MADTNRGIWTCKIGEVDRAKLPSGSDNYMRDALGDVYESLVGERPTFIFSGWGGELTEPERAVVEDREPAPPMADTLEELMAENAKQKELLHEYQEEIADMSFELRALREKAAKLDALEADPKSFYAALIRSYESRARALRESHDALVIAAMELMLRSHDAQLSLPDSPTVRALVRARTEMGAALAKAEAFRYVCDCGADSDAHTKECAYSRRLDAEALHG